ncbi:homing endonuclease [Bacillus phage vB_BanS_Sophrita]|uniref:GIY-YIG endonuclease n=1 Tax=Bacillus phage vB_BanS_Sophrita TaxID=2894790 RepID=A0AAE9CE98_9CAUD|nr:homing endonuclease [Bacillus phage vB_BanS_Sophrita]UGO50702.1 GIY-YIG endonuclease [Bacillus phage vB_BanS_Sophrita]
MNQKMNNIPIYGYIYMIENVSNKKKYIGQTVDIKKRMERHKQNMRNGIQSKLYSAMRKYGEDGFTLSILEAVYSKEEADEAEKFYIELFDTFNSDGYNMTAGGDGFVKGENHPMYGKKHSEESRRKIGLGHKGKFVSDETREKLSALAKNRYVGENNPNVKLTEKEVLEIIELINTKQYELQEIAEMFCVKPAQISKINCGRAWKKFHHLIRK